MSTNTRAQRARRLLALQQQLHRVEQWKLIALQRRSAELDTERRELIEALNHSDALQGLFMDATARRLMSIAREADAVARDEAKQAARVGERAIQVACAERLSETAEQEAGRAREKQMLGDVIERLVGSTAPASRKIVAP
jgi:hypothetical protein